MEIGETIRRWTVEPVEAPRERPAPEPEREQAPTPEREEVPA